MRVKANTACSVGGVASTAGLHASRRAMRKHSQNDLSDARSAFTGSALFAGGRCRNAARKPAGRARRLAPVAVIERPTLEMESMKASTRSVLAIILGGGAGTRLYPLTKQRAKPAVPIGVSSEHRGLTHARAHPRKVPQRELPI